MPGHEQTIITIVNDYLYEEPYPMIECDAEIADIIYNLNMIGAETELSCAHNTEQDLMWILFSERGFRQLIRLAYIQARKQDDMYNTLYDYLQYNHPEVIVDDFDGCQYDEKRDKISYNGKPPESVKIEYSYSLKMSQDEVGMFSGWTEELREQFPDN